MIGRRRFTSAQRKALPLIPAFLGKTRQQAPGDGLKRFRAALGAIPPGGEAHVWVRMPINLGDVVMALPSLFAIKACWEACAQARGVELRVTVMGKGNVALFREAVPQVFAACLVDAETPFSRSPLQLVKHWRKQRPVAVISYSKSDRIKLAAWLAGVPVRAGIADGGNNWCFQFSHPFAAFAQNGHRSFRYLPLTRWLAGPETALRFERLGPEQYGGASVLERLKDLGWDGGPYVVFGVFPTLGCPERRWFPDELPWTRLAGLARRAGVTPVLAGGPEHREELEQLARSSGSLSMGGRTDLPQLMALLACAKGTIAVDTGIAHLAAATGQPTVVVFGQGLEYWDMPCGPKVVSLRGDPAGAPAYAIAPGSLACASTPWCEATSTIPAERAWNILESLAGEP
jgi:ADP-heptose:LPS heptosyltransferase